MRASRAVTIMALAALLAIVVGPHPAPNHHWPAPEVYFSGQPLVRAGKRLAATARIDGLGDDVGDRGSGEQHRRPIAVAGAGGGHGEPAGSALIL